MIASAVLPELLTFYIFLYVIHLESVFWGREYSMSLASIDLRPSSSSREWGASIRRDV